MTDASQPPKIPWWVSYWTDPLTTRSSLRQQAWLFFLMAALSLGIGTLSLYWQPVLGRRNCSPGSIRCLACGIHCCRHLDDGRGKVD